MPLKYGDTVVLYDGVSLKGWKGEEKRTYEFMDDGQVFNHPDHGVSDVYHVQRRDEKTDHEKDWSLFIRANSPVYFGAAKVLTAESPILKGRTFEIVKKTGAEQKDTRYEFKEVFAE